MSNDEGLRLSRRSVLAGTTAFGLAGTSTAVAGLGSEETGAEFDPDDAVDWGENAWPQIGFDNANTNYDADGNGPTGELTGAWSFDPYDDLNEDPVVADGTVYTVCGWPASGDEHLFALDAETGTQKWKADTEVLGGQGYSTNDLVVADGIAYLSTFGHTEAFDAATGTKLWSVERGGEGIKVTDESVVAFAGTREESAGGRRVLAMSRNDGSIQWERSFERYYHVYMAIVDDSVYAAMGGEDWDSGSLFSFALDDGTTEWRRDSFHTGPLTATDDELFVTTRTELVAVDAATGEKLWSKETDPADNEYDPGITVDAVGGGTVYATDEDVLHAFDPATGAEQWHRKLERAPGQTPVVSGGVLYYLIPRYDEMGRGDVYDHLGLLDAETGERIAEWTIPDVTGEKDDGNSNVVGPILPVDGTLYTCSENALVAIRERSGDSDTGEDDQESEGDGSGNDGSGDTGDESGSGDTDGSGDSGGSGDDSKESDGKTPNGDSNC